MTRIQPPTFLQGRTDHTARGDRLAFAGIVKTSGKDAFGDLAVTQNSTPNMQVIVGSGGVWILGGNTARQGAYHCINDGNELVGTVAAAHATLTRYDIIVAEVRDAFYSGTSNDWQFRIISGTAGSGSEPAVPVNAVRLARITVGPGVTSITNANITNYQQLARLGELFDVANTTELNAITSPWESMLSYKRDSDELMMYTGATWVPMARKSDIPAVLASVHSQFSTSKIANGATMTTLVIPAYASASTKVRLGFWGQAGFDNVAQEVGVSISSSAGTLTPSPTSAVSAAAAKWAPVVFSALLSLPAATEATITLVSSSSGPAYFRGMLEALRETV